MTGPAGLAVTAFVRDAAKLEDLASRVTVVTGDLSTADLSSVIRGHDAVLEATASRAGGDFEDMRVIKHALADAAAAAGVRRAIFTGGMAILPLSAPLFKAGIPLPDWLLKASIVHEANRVKLADAGLDYTFLCPAGMVHEAAHEIAAIASAYDAPVYDPSSLTVPYADVARWAVAHLWDADSFGKCVSIAPRKD